MVYFHFQGSTFNGLNMVYDDLQIVCFSEEENFKYWLWLYKSGNSETIPPERVPCVRRQTCHEPSEHQCYQHFCNENYNNWTHLIQINKVGKIQAAFPR